MDLLDPQLAMLNLDRNETAGVARCLSTCEGKGLAKKEKNTPAGDDEEDKLKPLGSSKAVDTLFRNAIRAELDLINLAATKANIMISLNGLIISALMISGAFIFASSPAFMLPALAFMITAAISIIFALASAAPKDSRLMSAAREGIRQLWQGHGTARNRRSDDDDTDAPEAEEPELNLLIYEDRASLSRHEYWDRMEAMLRDRDDVYYRMSDQLYWLGKMADRKFRMLNVSYTAFRWGLVSSVVLFVGLRGLLFAFPGLTGQEPPRISSLGISELQDIYEPSAVQQLPDGRILVVEDEASRAISILEVGNDGRLVENAAADQRFMRQFGRRLNDLEGLSIDDDGMIYAVTSHSLNSKDERNENREHLLRFEVLGSRVGQIGHFGGLRDALLASDDLHRFIEEETGERPDLKKLNIEGLSFHGGRLLLGLRSPRVAGRSIIVPIENVNQVFDGDPPQFGRPNLLDLQGGGIRALSYDPVLATFLIVNEIETQDGSKVSQLWSWTGQRADPAEPVAFPDIINLNNVESIDSVEIHGQPRLLIMSDEGNPEKNEAAKYMMMDYGQL